MIGRNLFDEFTKFNLKKSIYSVRFSIYLNEKKLFLNVYNNMNSLNSHEF